MARFNAFWIPISIIAGAVGAAAHATQNAIPAGSETKRVVLARCDGSNGYAAAGIGARSLLWRPEWLTLKKAEIGRDPTRKVHLRTAADAALLRGPYSVRSKAAPAPGSDPGDYVSIGPYWWPNPDTANGLPYVRRDGQTNPERDGERFDSKRMESMADDVVLLSLAGYQLDDPRYAAHAASLVRAWFVDPETRMNPHLTYAQAVPGHSAGRPFGVIDAVVLLKVAESITLLEAADAIPSSESAAIRRWYGDLAKWMATSDNGRAAAATANNHSLYFDLMFAHFSLFAGNEAAATEVSLAYAARRLAQQINAAGELPHELARTRPWSYSVFSLKAALQMAMLGECVGVDLWNWNEPDGRSLRKAVDYLSSHRQANLEDWDRPDLDLADPTSRSRVLREADQLFRLAAWGWRDPSLPAGEASDDLIPGYPR